VNPLETRQACLYHHSIKLLSCSMEVIEMGWVVEQIQYLNRAIFIFVLYFIVYVKNSRIIRQESRPLTILE